MPSNQVWSNFEPSSPHFLNQAPPEAQQLRWPDVFTMPHLGHVGLVVVSVVVPVVVVVAALMAVVVVVVVAASMLVPVVVVVVA